MDRREASSRCASVLAWLLLATTAAPAAGAGPGEIPRWSRSRTAQASAGALQPIASETGLVSLSVDGLGTLNSSGTVQVTKPASANVRGAFLFAASTGLGGPQIPDGVVTIDGQAVNWQQVVPSSISSFNHLANVTGLVKPKLDGATPGLVDFTIGEGSSTFDIDGEVLAVIFNDPNQPVSNTIVLLFGAQNVAGDTFAIGLAEPIDTSDPDLVLNLSLGISFSAQPGQFSQVDVNGSRLTTAAGGDDDKDGPTSNGALLTVGGIGDSTANPADPFALATNARSDDELYDLKPFVQTGDTSITVDTLNPSNDDNIFFASLFLASTTAVVGEGILLTPVSATNPLGAPHTVTATLQDDAGNPIPNRSVTFRVISGPNAGLTGNSTSDASGQATFTYTSQTAGTDTIEASFLNSQEATVTSNQVTKDWIGNGVSRFVPGAFQFTDPANAYVMIGSPLILANPDPTAVLGPNPGERGDYRLFRFDPSVGAYREFVSAGDPFFRFLPGVGFWLVEREPTTVTFEGDPVPDDPFDIVLAPGFNQIGTPYNVAIDWAGAVAPTLPPEISPALFSFEQDGHGGAGYVLQGVMEPAFGYWVFNFGTENATLSIPRAPASAASPHVLRATTPGTRRSWRVRLSASMGEASDADNYIGLDGYAQNGLDSLDYPEPPPWNGLAVYFPHREWNAEFWQYSTDVRAVTTSKVAWSVDVTTDRINAPITLSWKYDDVGRWRLVLRDVLTGVKVNMRLTPSYTYDSGTGGMRRFQITASPP